MDALWRTHVFSGDDFHIFQTTRIQSSTVLFAPDNTGDNSLSRDTLNSALAWASWFSEREYLYDLKRPESAASILLFKRATRAENLPPDTSNLLQYLPVSLASFRQIVDNFHLHRALPIFLQNGAAAFSRIPCEIDDRECKVYTLRVENTMEKHTALTITYFPKTDSIGSKIYALVLGFDKLEIEEFSKRLRAAGEHLFSPFTLMKIFLELEKDKRFNIVTSNVATIQGFIENYGRIPAGADRRSRNTKADSDDPHKLLELYLAVGHLKSGLAAWKAQLLGMKKFIREFRVMTSPGSQEIDPNDYLSRLNDEYQAQIGKCETVLLAISLAFQKDTAHQARIDTRQMKALAILTMAFLPGTFIAILMTVPEFESMKNIQAIPEWSWYLVLSLPLIAVVLGIYVAYVYVIAPEKNSSVPSVTG